MRSGAHPAAGPCRHQCSVAEGWLRGLLRFGASSNDGGCPAAVRIRCSSVGGSLDNLRTAGSI